MAPEALGATPVCGCGCTPRRLRATGRRVSKCGAGGHAPRLATAAARTSLL